MPWMVCGEWVPPERTGERVGSTANTWSWLQRGLRTSAMAVMWPPVPTPVMT